LRPCDSLFELLAAAYDLEDWNGVDRHHFNAIVADQDFTDTYQVSPSA
jgi:hypothetical protein